ncbi:MAG: hypothetical protein GYB65_10190 [Chloroflexi bacterium]|nr:hypothetical protein [Chloroflexota bacterium]
MVYCKCSHRSVIAMVTMHMLGYENVSALAGGLNAWTAAGYEVVSP